MKRLMSVIVLVLLPISGGCQGSVLDNSVWASAARIAGLDVATLYAIAIQESGMRWSDGSYRPWPWTLRVNTDSHGIGKGERRYATKLAAVSALKHFVGKGINNIDVGVMQVNLRWHGHRVHNNLSVLLEPAANIMAAATYLREINAKTRHQKLSDYHAPSQSARGTAYANRVNFLKRIVDANIR